MALPTLPGDEKKRNELNPGQRDYDRRFNDIAQAEEQGTFNEIADNYDKTADNTQENNNINSLKNRESEGDKEATGGFTSNYTGAKQRKTKSRAKFWLKRAAPALGIGGGLGIFGILLLGLTAPSLLIVQMKETMTSKFNTQLSSMEVRSNRLLLSQVQGSTKGFCNAKVSIKCKFTSLNDKRVTAMKKAGFTFENESKNRITGRTTYSGLEFDGKKINASNLASTISTDPAVRSAFKTAYNPKYAGFVGKAWSAVAAKYKISKQSPDLGGEDPEKARTKLNTIAKEGMTAEGGASRTIVAGEKKYAGCEGNNCTWTQADVDQANSTAGTLDADGKSGASADNVKSTLNNLDTEIGIASAGNLVKITGIADSACTAIGALNTLTYAAKAVRTLQLVRYMMVFSSVADSIKAGTSPKPEDVAYLGTILTTTTKKAGDASKTVVGSATDSFGYKYAAYGDSSASKESMNIANRFMAGGGMVGSISSVSNTVYGFFSPGNRAGAREAARNTCGVLANPVVQGASLLIGVAALFVPGVNVGLEIAKGAAVATFGIAISLIPSMVSDIVAGTVTEDIAGEESGNAIASGYGSLLSDSLAGQNGAAPMSKDDTVAYNNLQSDTVNQYIADEMDASSPLDATNPHSFIGSIAASLIPLRSQSNPLSTFSSLVASSVKSVIPTTKAASNEQYAQSLEVCQDPDAQDGGFAVDPFCNVIRGIPPQYLNRDPLDVADSLLVSGDIDEAGIPQTKYAEFIKKCMTSDSPLGYTETTYSPDEAKGCVINDSNANYYLNYMDQRIELGMSGEDTEEATSAPVTTDDKKALAQKIIAKNKVTYLGDVKPKLEDIASGAVDPNTEPCGVNIYILRVIDSITDKHAIKISDINRKCRNYVIGSGTRSRHFAGNGSGLDIAVIDGKATSGRDANAISAVNLVMPILSESATSSGGHSQVGQVNCGAAVQLAAGVRAITDGCSHLHIDVQPASDKNLKFDPSGF